MSELKARKEKLVECWFIVLVGAVTHMTMKHEPGMGWVSQFQLNSKSTAL